MSRYGAIATLLVFGVLLLAGCSVTPDRQTQLDDTLRAYERAVRWGEFPAAAAFARPQARPKDFTRFAHIKITAYDVAGLQLSKDGEHLTQIVKISYYDTDYMVEKSVVDRQEWEYDAKEAHWYITSGLPKFK
ncbi:MAG: hypothetical protein P8009_04670 [Gammaproteobacteria bacterium]|nr:hypothetical protein [Gammaproteobacteria bacterium]